MKGKVDSEDAILAPVFTLAAAAGVGIADVQAFSHSIQDTAFSMGGSAISIASLLAALALGAAFITNDADLDKLDDEYYYAALLTVAMVVAIPLVPAAQDFVTSNDFIAVLAVAIQSLGFMAVSYLA